MKLNAEQRAALNQAKAKVREIMKPEREAEKIARRAARRKRDKAIVPAAGQREPRERDPGFLAYLRRQPCAAAGLGGCSGPIQAAHIRYSEAGKGRNPGMQRKAHDRDANPLCEGHHLHDQHRTSERLFWERVGVDAYANAARHFAAYNGAGQP